MVFQKGNQYGKMHKGKIFTKRHKQNLSKALTGKVSKRKGKTMVEEYGNEKAQEIKEKIRKKVFLKVYSMSSKERKKIYGGCKGKKLTEEHKRKISPLGRKHSFETREKISKSHMGLRPSEKTRLKLREARAKQVFPLKDSSIEVKIQNFLKELNIEYFTHQHIKIEHGYQCDILIPSMNLVIECDGDYWHRYPIGRDIDKIRTKELIEDGFKVLRLWEHEIRSMRINRFKERLEIS